MLNYWDSNPSNGEPPRLVILRVWLHHGGSQSKVDERRLSMAFLGLQSHNAFRLLSDMEVAVNLDEGRQIPNLPK
jgi:hypothetical protein